jgi:glutamate transport system permease protein
MTDTSALRFADPLGPKGRSRVIAATMVALLALAAVVVVVVLRFADSGQLAWRLWKPFFTADGVEFFGVGLLVTLEAGAVSMVLSTLVGVVLASGRLIGPRLVRSLMTLWVEFFRGIPLALLLIFLFLYLPRVRVDVGRFWFLVWALTLYNSAVISEIVRAGVLSLDRGQSEASSAIGLTNVQALRLVILPQALRRMIPAMVSQMVVILKDTSLGVLISLEELLRRAQLGGSSEAAPLQALAIAAVIYLVVNLVLSWQARRLERRQGRIRKAAPAEAIRVRGVEDLTV